MKLLLLICLSLLISAGSAGARGVGSTPFLTSEIIENVSRGEEWSNPFLPLFLEEFMIDTSITCVPAPYGQQYPSVAFDGTNYLIVWYDWRNFLDCNIYGARVDASGRVLDPSGIPISTAADWQGFPSVAFDGVNYLVVWEDGRSDSTDIYGARVDPATGGVLDPSGIAISIAACAQRYPSVAFDGTNYFVVWQDYRSGSDWDIYGARVHQSGTLIDSSGIAISTAVEWQWYPSVAFHGTNYFLVWQDYRSGSDCDIYGARVDSSGMVLDPSGIAVSSLADYQWHPSVAFDGMNYLVVWEDRRSGFDYDIYGARVDTFGTVLDPAGIAISTAIDQQESPSVAFDGTNYLVVWHDGRSDSADIYGARVDTSGAVLDSSGIAISTTAYGQWFPWVSSGETNYVVVWHDGRSGSDYDIYGSRVSASGTVLDPPGILISTVANGQGTPSAAFGATNYFVVWKDYRSASADIYGARVDSSGTVLDSLSIAISATGNGELSPSVASDEANYLVVWSDYRSASADIYGARVDSSGAVLDPLGIAISTAAYGQAFPSVTFCGANYLVVWVDGRNYPEWGIYGARVDTSGAVLDSSGIAISTASWYQRFPSVSFDGTNYFVVWEDWRTDPYADIYGARVDTSGAVLDPSGIAISPAADQQESPSVTFDGTNYLVVWEDHRNGSDWDIYGARVDTLGAVLDSSGIAICTAAYAQLCPSVTFDGTNYLVVWQDGRNDPDRDIYGARVDRSGTVLDPSGIELINKPYDRMSPAIVRGSDSQLFLVYEGFAPEPYSTERIFGAFYPEVGVEENPSYASWVVSHAPFIVYPNPMRGSGIIRFLLPRTGKAELCLYNLVGQQVKVLLNEELDTGQHRIEMTTSDLPSGIYFCRLTARNFTETKKLVVLR